MSSAYDESVAARALREGAAALGVIAPTSAAALGRAVDALDRTLACGDPAAPALCALRLCFVRELAAATRARALAADPELEAHALAGLLPEGSEPIRHALETSGARAPGPAASGAATCELCFGDDAALVANTACGHAFCGPCWRASIECELSSESGCAAPTCAGVVGASMVKCPECVGERVLAAVLPPSTLAQVAALRASVSNAAVPELVLALAAMPHASEVRSAVAVEPVSLYHYTLCGEDDAGWGCAYRCAQMVLAHCVARGLAVPPGGRARWAVPNLLQLQYELAACGALKVSSIGSREWIEPPQIATLLAERYAMRRCASFEHVRSARADYALAVRLLDHFARNGTPVVIDDRVMAYVVAGVREVGLRGEFELAVLNPHFRGRLTRATIADHPFAASWQPLERAMAAKRWLVLLP